GRGSLLLPEGAEEHVGKRAVHGFGHVHGENETGSSVESARDNQKLALQDKTHGGSRETGVGIQERNNRGHVRATDGDNHHHAKHHLLPGTDCLPLVFGGRLLIPNGGPDMPQVLSLSSSYPRLSSG